MSITDRSKEYFCEGNYHLQRILSAVSKLSDKDADNSAIADEIESNVKHIQKYMSQLYALLKGPTPATPNNVQNSHTLDSSIEQLCLKVRQFEEELQSYRTQRMCPPLETVDTVSSIPTNTSTTSTLQKKKWWNISSKKEEVKFNGKPRRTSSFAEYRDFSVEVKDDELESSSTTCPQCQLTYDTLKRRPRLLSCKHNICESCVFKQLNTTFWTVTCKTCDKSLELPLSNRLKSIPLNKSLMQKAAQQ